MFGGLVNLPGASQLASDRLLFLGELPKSERKLPPVYLCETGADGASCRLKWLASTCVAGMVGVCLIGVAIYASMNMDDGSGMVSSIRRASLAALQPIRGARLANDGQSPNGQKEDRIQMTSAGFVTRHVIHDTVTERQGSREFITIKPYVRIVAGLATDLPEDADKLPPFNPYKLYSDQTPVGAGETGSDAPQAVSVKPARTTPAYRPFTYPPITRLPTCYGEAKVSGPGFEASSRTSCCIVR